MMILKFVQKTLLDIGIIFLVRIPTIQYPSLNVYLPVLGLLCSIFIAIFYSSQFYFLFLLPGFKFILLRDYHTGNFCSKLLNLLNPSLINKSISFCPGHQCTLYMYSIKYISSLKFYTKYIYCNFVLY